MRTYPESKVYTDPNAKDGELLVGYKGTSVYEAGFFYAPYIPLQADKIEANPRKLKAEWTMEVAEDLKAVHGLDAEAELANILAAEILAEINREIIRTLHDLVEETPWTAQWDFAKDIPKQRPWQFVQEPQAVPEQVVNDTPTVEFKQSDWFGFTLSGETQYDYRPMVGRREEATELLGLRTPLDVGEDG